MKLLTTLTILTTMTSLYANDVHDDPERMWNVLSLDGGGIRGLITATVVDYMEK
jgi:hypothetical protein